VEEEMRRRRRRRRRRSSTSRSSSTAKPLPITMKGTRWDVPSFSTWGGREKGREGGREGETYLK